MKKLLLATSALVATTGLAAADVGLSGFAEVGIFNNENGSGDGSSGDLSKTRVYTDLDVTFSMSGEADNGLTFGASVDLDESDGGAVVNANTADAARLPDATIFLSYGPATLTVGDTDSAFDARLTEVAVGGAINDDHTVHPGYSGNSGLDEVYGGQEIRFDYSFDSFTASVSTSPDRNATDFDASLSVGVSYSTSLGGVDLGLGLGYITVGEAARLYDSALGFSIDASFAGGFQAILNFTSLMDETGGGADNGSHTAIGLGYSANNLTIGLNYGVFEVDDAFGVDSSGGGLTVNYDLGGGLEVLFGYGTGDIDGPADYEDTFSLGLAMSF